MHEYSSAFSEDKKTVRAIGREYNVSELEVIKVLDADKQARLLEKEYVKKLIEELPTLGELLFLVEHGGSIFEIKSVFPQSQESHGYCNLGRAPFSGHLNLEKITNIGVISETMYGRRSCNWVFLGENGETVFKVYIGRDQNKELLKNQLDVFERWFNL
ncbi:MAG: heme utilization cystosolic carrier protein HutX [Endomicrobium sp.]|jgi:putative heme utilization carrier protein HutX|nr:heme utilization cystosolic carrier protein HutX [Endomicrobium sp.]